MPLRTVTLAAALILLLSPALADKPAAILTGPEGIAIKAVPIDFDRDRAGRREFGKLIWRGGLNLFVTSRHFGGYSGIAVDGAGRRLLAVSDSGTWLRAELDYDGRYLTGIGKASIGPILGRDGKPLATDRQRDSEGLAIIRGDTSKGTAYVSFERDHRILRFPFTPEAFGPPNGSLSLPPEAKGMQLNRGIEAIAPINSGKLKGAIVVFSERLLDRKGNFRGWILGRPKPVPITLARIGTFDITDAAALPDGGILILERSFSFQQGVKMRIRRIGAEELKPGAVIEGEVLLEAHDGFNIDNMEGIAVHRSSAGETILTLISDDNFSPLQRTLLMQFALPDEKPVLAEPRER